MSNANLFIQVGLRGADAASAGMRRMADSGSQAAGKLAGAWGKTNRVFSETGALLRNTAMFLGGGALVASAVRDVTEFERGLTEMRLTAGLTAAETDKIRRRIIALSSETLQLPEDQLAAFKDMVAAGIEPGRALAGLEAINRTATATFSNVRDIAASSVDLIQKFGIAPAGLERAFNIMAKGGKEGRFELRDMAQQFPSIASDAAKFGITGERGLAQVTAMLQMSRKGTADASTAANNMRNFFAQILQYREQFGKAGIDVFKFVDVKTGKFKGDFDEFFTEIMEKTKGSAAVLQLAGIRDRQSMDFIVQMMQNWKEYARVRDEALSAAGANVVGRDFGVVADTTFADMRRLEVEKSKAMKSEGSAWFSSQLMAAGNWAIENPLAAVGLAAGGWFGGKALLGRLGRGGAAGGLGGFAGGMGGPTPVYVVNKHLSMLPGPGLPAASVPGLLTKFTTLLRGPVAAAGIAKTAGLVAVAGAAGAAVGTGINYLIDKAFGEKGGLGSWLYDVLHPSEAANKNNINLSVNIAKDGRVSTVSDDLSTSIDMQRGDFALLN